jgi:putative ABC transport system permease protein
LESDGREILFESVTLGLIGGALGLFLAQAGVRLLMANGPRSIPRLEEISIDPAVLPFTAGVSVFAGVLFGLIPVFSYGKPDLAVARKEGGRSFSHGKERHRARNALVILQIALALVLLISSGLLIRTFQAMRKVPPDSVVRNCSRFQVSPPLQKLPGWQSGAWNMPCDMIAS